MTYFVANQMLCALFSAWNHQVGKCCTFYLLSELINIYTLKFFFLVGINFIQLHRDQKHWQNVAIWGIWKVELKILIELAWKPFPCL